MDTNDYGQSTSENENNEQSDHMNTQAQGMNQSDDAHQGGGYYEYDAYPKQQDMNKTVKSGRGGFTVFLMLICVILGGIVTAYVIIPAFTADIVDIAKDACPAVVRVTVSISQDMTEVLLTEDGLEYDGTGFVISKDGYIVTNNHVITGSDSITVMLEDGKEYDAAVIGVDVTTDIAVIKIDAAGLDTLPLGDSDTLQVGEAVVAIGNPLGLELPGTVTSGIISGLNRALNSDGYTQEYIQTDAAINPGNSGGPLINMDGEVIGINTLKSYIAGYDDYGQSISTEGIGFAIPITSAIPIIEQLISEGSIERPGIGISCLVDETNYYNPSGAPEGVTVVDIVEGGPADLAGIEPSDIITTMEGTPVKTVEELTMIIYLHHVGDVIDITVWRDGEEYNLEVTIGNLNDM
ncbi:MAG: trypsin-like peptidase domain-containing protein [Eubacteriales bacterium]|nr:trypsin-like peptidase domain-containing protein [Eubacteriales bacterium]